MPPTIDSATSRRQPAGGEIVEEEQRLGALHQDVVDAVIDEIGADRIVAVGQERDLQLGADAIGARRRAPDRGYRPGSSLKQPAEGADVGEDAAREGRPRQAADAADGFVARVDVDAGSLVVHQPTTGCLCEVQRQRNRLAVPTDRAGSGFSFSASCR